jgi:hypothetical protein
MKNLARLSGLVAALCLVVPATSFAHDHHGGFHGRFSCGPRFFGLGAFPFIAAAPYFAYYDAPYYDTYYAGPSVGVSASTGPYGSYRGAPVDDHSDDLAIDVQRALRRDGYYRGSIDGDIGSGTRAAIRQFQYDHHLEVTGRIDRALLHSLDLD